MALIIVLACLALQRYLQFCSYPYVLSLTEKYYQVLHAKLPLLSSSGRVTKICILIIPALILTIITAALVHQVLFSVGYYIFSLLLVWYVCDYRDLVKSPYSDMSMQSVLSHRYSHVFALIFWYMSLGLFGLVLYAMVTELTKIVAKKTSDEVLHGNLVLMLGVLDWIPVRLLGLTFALVGHFSAVFPLWLSGLSAPIANCSESLLPLTHAAISKMEPENPVGEIASQGVSELITLLDRSLVVWLVVLLVVILSGVIS